MSTDETPKKLQDIRDELRIQREIDTRQFATQTENTKKYTEELRTMRKDMGNLPEGVEDLLNKMLKFDVAVEKEVQKRYDQDKRVDRRGRESDREWQKQFLKSMGMIKKGIKKGQGAGMLPKTPTAIGLGALAALVGTLAAAGRGSVGIPKNIAGHIPTTTKVVKTGVNRVTAPVVDPTVELLKKQKEMASKWVEDFVAKAGKLGKGLQESLKFAIPESFGRARDVKAPKILEIMKSIKEFMGKGWDFATKHSQFLKGIEEMTRGGGRLAGGAATVTKGAGRAGLALGKGLSRGIPIISGGLAANDAMNTWYEGPGGLQGGGEAAGIFAERYLNMTTMGLLGDSNIGQNTNLLGERIGQVAGDLYNGSIMDAVMGASELPVHITKGFEDIADSGFAFGTDQLFGEEGILFGLWESPFQDKKTHDMANRFIDIDIAKHSGDYMDGAMMAGEGIGRVMIEKVLEEPWYRKIVNGMFNTLWQSTGGSGNLNIVPPGSAGKLDVDLGGSDRVFHGLNMMSGSLDDSIQAVDAALHGPEGGRGAAHRIQQKKSARMREWNRKQGGAREAPVPGLAFGGIVKGLGDGIGGLFRLGEKGDEMVAPLKSLADELIRPLMSEAQGLVSEGSRNLPALINPIMSKGMNMARGFLENDQVKDLTASMPAMLDKIAGMVPSNIAISGPTITTSNSTTVGGGGGSVIVRNPDFSRKIDMNC